MGFQRLDVAVRPNFREILLDECDRHAPGADTRGHALDRAVPNVSRREDAWHTRHAVLAGATAPPPARAEGTLDHRLSFHIAESYIAAGDHKRGLALLEDAMNKGFHPRERLP
jgi:hypothetical protein